MPANPPKPKPDYSTWYTKEVTAEMLECSTKTVEKYASDKRLHMVLWSAGTGNKKARYHPGDVERLRQQLHPGAPPFVMPAASAEIAIPGKLVDETAQNHLAELSGLVRALTAALLRSPISPPDAPKLLDAPKKGKRRKLELPLNQKLFLTVRESAAYVGYPEEWLRNRIAVGLLDADRSGGYMRIRRSDLEKL